MNKPLDGAPLPNDTTVLRLPKPPPDFMADRWRPDWAILNPSTTDKEHAKQHGKPIRVSVWDHAHTTVEQARSFRTGPTLVLTLGVRDVFDVANRTGCPMPIVYDPLGPPEDARPGACGHAGIEGLERAETETKNQRKNRLAAIAERMKLLDGPVERQ